MRCLRFVGLLLLSILATVVAEATAQDPQPESPTRQQFNQVFVKLIMPGISPNSKENDSVVEAWIAGELKKLGQKEYFALTGWVPVCDALLEDDVVDNRVWGGGRVNRIHYCHVHGDIPERRNGRLLVNVSGWSPATCEANITLPDEPGSRAIGQMQVGVGEVRKQVKIKELLPYVVVIIAPPEKEVDGEVGAPNQQGVGMIEEVDAEYQKQALQIAEKKLEEMNVPFQERTPTFNTVMINEKSLLEIRYSHSDPNVRAGDWILSFDPSKPIDANPVDIKIWR